MRFTPAGWGRGGGTPVRSGYPLTLLARISTGGVPQSGQSTCPPARIRMGLPQSGQDTHPIPPEQNMRWTGYAAGGMSLAITQEDFLVTARVRSMREGNVLTSVCPSIHPSVCPQGGVPISHNALQHFPECHEAAGGYPDPPRGVSGSGTPPGGYPGQVTPRGGTRIRYPPGGVPGPPPPRGGTWTLPGGVPRSGTPPGGVTRTPPGGGTRVRYPPGGGLPG